MDKKAVKKSIIINAKAADIWKALTDPATIKEYLFGTCVETDWKEGSPINFSGNWKGKEYHDKGEIIRVKENKKLEHTYWSSLSGLDDTPENYYTTVYEIDEREKDTILSVTQVGMMSDDYMKQCGENWETVLQKLRALVEKHPEVEPIGTV